MQPGIPQVLGSQAYDSCVRCFQLLDDRVEPCDPLLDVIGNEDTVVCQRGEGALEQSAKSLGQLVAPGAGPAEKHRHGAASSHIQALAEKARGDRSGKTHTHNRVDSTSNSTAGPHALDRGSVVQSQEWS